MTFKVCIIRQAIYPYDLLVRREAETLSQAGYETHVICLERPESDPNRAREEVINSVHVHHLPLKRKKTSTARYIYDYVSFAILACIKVTNLHLKHHFAVIQVNSMPDFLVFSTILVKAMGAKIISMMYEPTPELWEDTRKERAPQILKKVEQAALRYAGLSFTVTQQMKDLYISRGARPEKIRVVLNAPDESFLEMKSIPAGEDSRKDGFVLVCHGAIEERYGQDTILKAVALVKPLIPGIRVRILGKGTYVDQMLKLRQELNLEDCVDYLGYVPLEQMVRELRTADVGIIAQKSSPYSNLVHTGKMYDYISLGRPVLASRLKAVEAYFGQNTLAFFEPDDPKSLAERIIDLYRHPEKRESLAGNAQELYIGYRWKRQKEIYLSAYQELLGSDFKDVSEIYSTRINNGEERR